jgi:predicted YcjX-like family ATPase
MIQNAGWFKKLAQLNRLQLMDFPGEWVFSVLTLTEHL